MTDWLKTCSLRMYDGEARPIISDKTLSSAYILPREFPASPIHHKVSVRVLDGISFSRFDHLGLIRRTMQPAPSAQQVQEHQP